MNPNDFYKKWGAVASQQQPSYQYELTKQGMMPIGQAQAKQTANPKKNRDLLDTLLSLGLGTAGTVGGALVGGLSSFGAAAPIGAVAGGAGGSALAEYLTQLRHGDNDTGAIVREGALGGLFSIPGSKLLKGGAAVTKGLGKEALEQGVKTAGENAVVAAGRNVAAKAAEKSAITNVGEGIARRSAGFIGGTKLGSGPASVDATQEAYKLLRNAKVINPARSAESNLARTEDFISGLWKPLQTSIGSKPVGGGNIASAIEKRIAKTNPELLKNRSVIDLLDNARQTVRSTSDLQRYITTNVDDLITFGRSGASKTPGVERAAQIAREVALESMPGASREVKSKLSSAYTARELLQKASSSLANADKGGITNQLAGLIRQGKGAAGEGIQNIGKIGEFGGFANQLPYATKGYGAVARQGLADMTSSALDPSNLQQPESSMIDPMAQPDMMTGMAPELQMQEQVGAGDPYADIRQGLQAAMIEDLQTTGGKRVGALKSVLDSLPDAPGTDAASKKNTAKYAGANAVLDKIEQSFNRAGGGRGTVGGLVGQLTSMIPEIDPTGNVYQGQRQAYLTQIIRAMGEVGTLTDKDREVVARSIPQLNDTPETAKAKIADLRDLLGQLQQRNSGYGDTSLQDVMLNMGVR